MSSEFAKMVAQKGIPQVAWSRRSAPTVEEAADPKVIYGVRSVSDLLKAPQTAIAASEVENMRSTIGAAFKHSVRVLGDKLRINETTVAASAAPSDSSRKSKAAAEK